MNKKDFDVCDVEEMDALAEDLAGTLMDAVKADNSVDPLSADYAGDDDSDDDELFDLLIETVILAKKDDVPSRMKKHALKIVDFLGRYGVSEDWLTTTKDKLLSQLN